MKSVFFIISLLVAALFGRGQSHAGFPVPEADANQLFYLQRTPNSNTVIYELNYRNGELDTDNPVHVFWIRYAEKGQRQELNSIQRRFAYGVHSKKLSSNRYEINLVSYKKLKMYLENRVSDKWCIYTYFNERTVILTSIFIKINGGSLWSPNIEYVEMSGIDPVANESIKERMVPERN